MTGSPPLDRVLEFINTQASPTPEASSTSPEGRHPPVITISRQAGAGAWQVAEELIRRLQEQTPAGSRPWTVFDRNLVEEVLEDHHLPARLASAMPEDRVSEIADTLEELFGLHPSARTLAHNTAETILRLAALGNVVVIGRGANIITSKVDAAFHVRLVGSLPNRVHRVMASAQLDEEAATASVRDKDLGRARYVKKYYGEDIDDPLLYDLVINTDRVPYAVAARIIADAVRARSHGRG